MTDLPALLDQYGAPPWIIITVVILIAVFSTKKAGQIPGLLGAWSRWITTRQERSIDRDLTLRQKIDAAVQERVTAEVAPIRADNITMSGEINYLRQDLEAERGRHRRELDRMRTQHARELDAERKRHRDTLEPVTAERDLLASWSVFVARWWHDKERTLAEMGVVVPPPPWPSFQTWLDEMAKRQNQEKPT